MAVTINGVMSDSIDFVLKNSMPTVITALRPIVLASPVVTLSKKVPLKLYPCIYIYFIYHYVSNNYKSKIIFNEIIK